MSQNSTAKMNGHATSTHAGSTHRIGVVGGGAAGTSFCLQLYSKLISQPLYVDKVEVLVFDKYAQAGPGNAYRINPCVQDSYRLNRPRDSMDVYAGRVGQFSDWLQENQASIGVDGTSEFPLRSTFGRYMLHLVEELKRVTAQESSPMSVKFITQTAVANVETKPDSKYCVHAADGREWIVDSVVFCVGHFPVTAYKHFIGREDYSHDIHSHRDMLSRVAGTDVPVGIIGCSLTAIDISVELERVGHTGKIIMGKKINVEGASLTN